MHSLIILAGGSSTRVGNIGKYVSKSLLPIFDTTLLARQVKQALDSKAFDNIIITTRPSFFPMFREYIDSEFGDNKAVQILENDQHLRSSLHALNKVLAIPNLERFTMSFADIYFSSNPFLKFPANLKDLLMGYSQPFSESELHRGGILHVQNEKVTAIRELPDSNNNAGYRWNGLTSARIEIKSELEKFLDNKDTEVPEGDFFQFLLEKGYNIQAVPCSDFINNNDNKMLLVSSLYIAAELGSTIKTDRTSQLMELASTLRIQILNKLI